MLLAALWKPCQRGPFSLEQGAGLVEGPRCVRRGARPRLLPSLLQGWSLLKERSRLWRLPARELRQPEPFSVWQWVERRRRSRGGGPQLQLSEGHSGSRKEWWAEGRGG
jgi:hypothetical protein